MYQPVGGQAVPIKTKKKSLLKCWIILVLSYMWGPTYVQHIGEFQENRSKTNSGWKQTFFFKLQKY